MHSMAKGDLVKRRPRLATVSVGVLVVAAVTLFSVAPAMGVSNGGRTASSTRPQTVDPVGTYSVYGANGVSGQLTVESNGSFTLVDSSASDGGYWALEGKYFAFVISASTAGDVGCMFLGKVDSGVGINTESKQGPYGCGTYTSTWYATLEAAGSARASASLTWASHGSHSSVKEADSPVGTYRVHLSDHAKGDLEINNGGTFALYYAHSGPTDMGYWLSFGKSYAQVTATSTSSEDDECLLLGEVNSTTGDIGTSSAPGPFVCGVTDQTGTWYATR